MTKNVKHDQNPFAANHYSLCRDMKYDYDYILMDHAEENMDVKCCKTFAFKYM